MSKYFKQVSRNMVFDRANRQIIFERTATGIGLIVLDEATDAEKIADLDVEADARRNGIVRISAEIYESEKKKTPSRPSQRRLDILSQLRVSRPPEPPWRKQPVVASVAGADKPSAPVKPVESAPDFQSFRNRARRASEIQIKPSDFTT